MAYLNFSRSFQPPSFDESLGIQGGPDGGQVFHSLRPQRAYTLEVGTRGEAGPFDWDMALYRSWVRDELLDQSNAQGEPLGTINAPRTVHQGLEVGLQAEVFRSLLVKEPSPNPGRDGKVGVPAPALTDRVILDQTYNLSDFRFEDNPTYHTDRIAGTPVHFYKAELRYEHPRGFHVGVNVEWNAVKYPVDEANCLFADPYALLGCRAGYRTAKGPQVSFEAKNLINQVYRRHCRATRRRAHQRRHRRLQPRQQTRLLRRGVLGLVRIIRRTVLTSSRFDQGGKAKPAVARLTSARHSQPKQNNHDQHQPQKTLDQTFRRERDDFL